MIAFFNQLDRLPLWRGPATPLTAYPAVLLRRFSGRVKATDLGFSLPR